MWEISFGKHYFNGVQDVKLMTPERWADGRQSGEGFPLIQWIL